MSVSAVPAMLVAACARICECVMPAAARLGLEEGIAYGPALTLD